MNGEIYLKFAENLLTKISDDIESQILYDKIELKNISKQIETINTSKITNFNNDINVINLIASIETIYAHLLNPSIAIDTRLDILDQDVSFNQYHLNSMNFSKNEQRNIIKMSSLIKQIINIMIKTRNLTSTQFKPTYPEGYYPVLSKTEMKSQKGGHMYNRKLNIIYLTKQL